MGHQRVSVMIMAVMFSILMIGSIFAGGVTTEVSLNNSSIVAPDSSLFQHRGFVPAYVANTASITEVPGILSTFSVSDFSVTSGDLVVAVEYSTYNNNFQLPTSSDLTFSSVEDYYSSSGGMLQAWDATASTTGTASISFSNNGVSGYAGSTKGQLYGTVIELSGASKSSIQIGLAQGTGNNVVTSSQLNYADNGIILELVGVAGDASPGSGNGDSTTINYQSANYGSISVQYDSYLPSTGSGDIPSGYSVFSSAATSPWLMMLLSFSPTGSSAASYVGSSYIDDPYTPSTFSISNFGATSGDLLIATEYSQYDSNQLGSSSYTMTAPTSSGLSFTEVAGSEAYSPSGGIIEAWYATVPSSGSYSILFTNNGVQGETSSANPSGEAYGIVTEVSGASASGITSYARSLSGHKALVYGMTYGPGDLVLGFVGVTGLNGQGVSGFLNATPFTGTAYYSDIYGAGASDYYSPSSPGGSSSGYEYLFYFNNTPSNNVGWSDLALVFSGPISITPSNAIVDKGQGMSFSSSDGNKYYWWVAYNGGSATYAYENGLASSYGTSTKYIPLSDSPLTISISTSDTTNTNKASTTLTIDPPLNVSATLPLSSTGNGTSNTLYVSSGQSVSFHFTGSGGTGSYLSALVSPSNGITNSQGAYTYASAHSLFTSAVYSNSLTESTGTYYLLVEDTGTTNPAWAYETVNVSLISISPSGPALDQGQTISLSSSNGETYYWFVGSTEVYSGSSYVFNSTSFPESGSPYAVSISTSGTTDTDLASTVITVYPPLGITVTTPSISPTDSNSTSTSDNLKISQSVSFNFSGNGGTQSGSSYPYEYAVVRVNGSYYSGEASSVYAQISTWSPSEQSYTNSTTAPSLAATYTYFLVVQDVATVADPNHAWAFSYVTTKVASPAPPPADSFIETGLPSGTVWGVKILVKGHLLNTYTSNGSYITVHLPNGKYTMDVLPITGYSSSPTIMGFTVFNEPFSFKIFFNKTTLNGYLTVSALNLNSSIYVDGKLYSTTSGQFNISLPPGNYTVSMVLPDNNGYTTSITILPYTVTPLSFHDTAKAKQAFVSGQSILPVLVAIAIALVILNTIAIIKLRRRKP